AFRVAAPADPRPHVPIRIHEHDVRDVDRGLALRDAARDVLGGVRARVALDHVDALDDHAAGGGHHAQDLSLAAPVPAGDDHDRIVLLQLGLRLRLHHSTSGAREMIFMNFFSRSSRATGPNTRVPIGSPSLEIRTAALSSNRMYEPSRRRWFRRVRTMTARTT